MKKLIMTIAIVLGLGMTSFADPNGGGLFQRGDAPEQDGIYGNRGGGFPSLPGHGAEGNQDADEVPMGTGIALLAALGGAYLVAKKRREE